MISVRSQKIYKLVSPILHFKEGVSQKIQLKEKLVLTNGLKFYKMISVFDAYSGSGGLSIGLSQAGLVVTDALENW